MTAMATGPRPWASGARRAAPRSSPLGRALVRELAFAGSADRAPARVLLHDVGRYAIDQSLVADTLEAMRTRAPEATGCADLWRRGAERVAW